MLLASAVSGELEKMSGKLDFWQVKHEDVFTLWESASPLPLETILSSIDPDKDFPDDYDFALLYGIGWEFIWGKKPPEIVRQMRRELIERAREGRELSDLEKTWYSLICVDTDMF
jgi:hypothetical protein